MKTAPDLHNVVILLAAAVFIVAIFRKLRVSPVLGYLVAGAAIGPFGFAIIGDLEPTSAIAELGVVFLLFVIGLELSFKKLIAMRAQVFGFGLAQVAVTSVVIGVIVSLLGQKIEVAIIIGGALSLSSTAVVLEVLHQQREESTQAGRLSLGALLMQDLVVVPMLVLLPVLASGESDGVFLTMGISVIKGLVSVLAILFVGWWIINPLYRQVASTHSAELFSAFTLFVILSFAFLTEQLGLSMALGAFLAGILVAETKFQHQVMAEVTPFKGLLLGLFFMTVGMSLDLNVMIEELEVILFLSLSLILIKALVIFGICKLFKYRVSKAFQVSLLLAQGGEFAFILFKLASDLRLIPVEVSELIMVVVTVSMAFTPLLAIMGKTGALALERKYGTGNINIASEVQDLNNHVVIAGFGRVGQTVATLMAAETVPFVATDLDPKTVSDARLKGIPVFYGDSTRAEVLKSIGIERACCFLVTVNDIKAATSLVSIVSKMYPDLPVIARARDEFHAEKLLAAGAKMVVPEAFEASLQLGGAVMEQIGIPDYEVSRIIHQFRAESLPEKGEKNKRDNGLQIN